MHCIATYVTVMYLWLSKISFLFLILDIYDLDTLYLHEQGCEDLWLFFKAKRSVSKKSWGNTDIVDK